MTVFGETDDHCVLTIHPAKAKITHFSYVTLTEM